MFTSQFLNKDLDEIFLELNKNGFVEIENVFNEKTLQLLDETILSNKDVINVNNLSGGYTENYFFISHFLTLSKEFFNFCISESIFTICKKYLGEKFYIRSSRYYETRAAKNNRNIMGWHTDNKNSLGYAENRGLVFLLFLNNSEGGETQFIRGSQNWSDKNKKNYFFVNENSKKLDIVTVKTIKNKLLIYDSRGVHQAKISKNKSFLRKTLFLQIDLPLVDKKFTSERNCEQIFINSEFLKKPTKELEYFLCFGVKHKANNPFTSLKEMPYELLTVKKYSSFFFYRFYKYLLGILEGIKRRIKNR
tara:strand:+ start:521 stop:1438 length:918 start_codon:yes stop_codon:yes gene_type:complete